MKNCYNPKCGKRVPTLYKNKGMYAWLCYDCSFKEEKKEVIISKDEAAEMLKKEIEYEKAKAKDATSKTGNKNMASAKKTSKKKI